MASDESMTPLSSAHDLHVDGYLAHDYTDDDDDGDGETRHHDTMYDDDEGIEEGDDVHMDIQMSRLSLETWEGDGDDDAHTHLSDHADDKGGASSCDDDGGGGVTWGSADCLSLPGTPTRCAQRRRAGSTKEYASESEAARDRQGSRARMKSCGAAGERSSSFSYSHYYSGSRKTRERQLDRAWEMKRCHWAGGDGGAPPDTHSGGSSPCVVVRTTGPGAGCMWMDMEEVKACRDLGLELPCDWTVEIPPSALTAVAAADAGSGGGAPIVNWRISSPGEHPPTLLSQPQLASSHQITVHLQTS